MKRKLLPVTVFLILWIIIVSCNAQTTGGKDQNSFIRPGAWQTELYIPLLQGKKIGVLGNHTSKIKDIHLVDTLLSAGLDIVRIFSPEHGFRGEAAAGEYVKNSIDPITGLPVISLYGSNRIPSPEDVKDLDVIIFDIQDVGVRFYTYISTMTYMMQTASSVGVPMIILDRPNPNGHITDGPLLDSEHTSFVGLHPIPVLHGMTVGEYAQMVNGQGWLENQRTCEIHIVKVENYKRDMYYQVPDIPSPNLPDMTSILLYPGLCFFEGTPVSIGRGTDFPFQVYGHPDFPKEIFSFTFTPESRRAAPHPPNKNQVCYGIDLRKHKPELLHKEQNYLDISHLLKAYEHFAEKESFFNDFFEKLAGTSKLRDQIRQGFSENEIRDSWQKDLQEFMNMREKYLLYNP
ncbi:MAG: exo-beta-N-acetylmuramidase NamZ domain-containing protein [Bacteroidota bacterium]